MADQQKYRKGIVLAGGAGTPPTPSHCRDIQADIAGQRQARDLLLAKHTHAGILLIQFC